MKFKINDIIISGEINNIYIVTNIGSKYSLMRLAKQIDNNTIVQDKFIPDDYYISTVDNICEKYHLTLEQINKILVFQ